MQGKLDGVFTVQVKRPTAFTHKNVVHTVTQFVACNNQLLAVVSKASFRNCLVAMWPSVMSNELPSSFDMMTYIHNKFVSWLENLKKS
ncbi:hypothetical protein BD779DRAFT_1447251 [Infundibulicybe gibba]|nr:hypothetical protein BD779DRAFT_1447251 [Infundibulicybe gibba]